MPKQVGNRTSRSLLRVATFDSLSKLYHTHYCKIIWSGCSLRLLRSDQLPPLSPPPGSYASACQRRSCERGVPAWARAAPEDWRIVGER